MTVIIEYQEVKERKLLFEFHFKRNEIHIGKNASHVCTLDKYMSLNDWMDIFHKLEKRIKKYVADVDRPLASETVELRHAQLLLKIDFKKVTESLIMVADQREADILPYFMCVHVEAISKVGEYIAVNGGKLTKYSSCGSSHSRSKSISPVHEEYVPECYMTTDEAQLTYIPSSNMTKAAKNEYTPEKPMTRSSAKNEYTPENMKTPKSTKTNARHEQNINKTTSKIIPGSEFETIEILSQSEDAPMPLKTEGKKHAQSASRTPNGSGKLCRKIGTIYDDESDSTSEPPQNQHTPTSKRVRTELTTVGSSASKRFNVSQDIFGCTSDDDVNFVSKMAVKESKMTDDEKDHFVTKRHRSQRNTGSKDIKYGPTQKTTTLKTPTNQRLLDGWCSKAKLENSAGAKDNANMSEPRKKRTVSKAKKAEKTEMKTEAKNESFEETNRKHQIRMKEWKKIEENLAEINQPISVDRVIDLKNMPVSGIIATFEEYETILFDIYNTYLSQKTHRVQTSKDIDAAAMHEMILTTDQAHRMVDTLRERFLVSADDGGNLDKLFFESMVPEWALAMIMSIHQMTRNDAIEHIRRQEIFLSHNASFKDLN